MSDSLDERQVEAALHVYRRYAAEVVEGLKLCPWALPARKAGRVRELVCLVSTEDPAPAAELAGAIAADTSIDIGLIIFPRLTLERTQFERYVARVRDLDTINAGPGGLVMAMAAFHPDAEPDLASAERLTPFLRCTPDPTIQLVRRDALEKVRSGDVHGSQLIDLSTIDLHAFLQKPQPKPLHERIADMNLETVKKEGVEHVRALLRNIREDRNARYAALS